MVVVVERSPRIEEGAASLPAAGPYLAACAVVALWIDLGSIHRDQHSDSILNVLISLYRWTPFVWEQDRFGMLVPLLAAPIKDPLANLLFQGFWSAFAGLAAFYLLARYAIRNPTYPLAATFGLATFLALTPAYYRFEYLVDTSYGIGLSLALWGLILVEREPTSWPRLIGALVLMGVAHWVNSAVAMFLGPFVLARGLLGAGAPGRWVAENFDRDDVLATARSLWRVEAVRALAVLAAGHATGQVLIELTPYRHTDLSAQPMAEWPHAWAQLLRVSWAALGPPLWLGPLGVGLGLATFGLVRPGPRRPAGVGRSALALLGTSALLWLLMGTRNWVRINDYEFRYLFPSALLGQAAVATLATAAMAGRVPTTPGPRLPAAAGALLLLLLTAATSYGPPSLAGVRRDLDRKCGGLTDDLIEARCTHLAGDYWKVWTAVFHANMVLHERGDPRVLRGVTFRCGPTFALWKDDPMDSRLAAVPLGDGLGEVWLHSYLFPDLREVEVRRTIRVLRPIPRKLAR